MKHSVPVLLMQGPSLLLLLFMCGLPGSSSPLRPATLKLNNKLKPHVKQMQSFAKILSKSTHISAQIKQNNKNKTKGKQNKTKTKTDRTIKLTHKHTHTSYYRSFLSTVGHHWSEISWGDFLPISFFYCMGLKQSNNSMAVTYSTLLRGGIMQN